MEKPAGEAEGEKGDDLNDILVEKVTVTVLLFNPFYKNSSVPVYLNTQFRETP